MGIILLKNKEISNSGIVIRFCQTNQSRYNDMFVEKSSAVGSQPEDITSIYLPGKLLSKAQGLLASKELRITTLLFDNTVLFEKHKEDNKKILSSKVFSAAIKSVHLTGLTENEELQSAFKPIFPVQNRSVECVFWDFLASSKYSNKVSINSIYYLKKKEELDLK